jgi:hypothetical protein
MQSFRTHLSFLSPRRTPLLFSLDADHLVMAREKGNPRIYFSFFLKFAYRGEENLVYVHH